MIAQTISRCEIAMQNDCKRGNNKSRWWAARNGSMRLRIGVSTPDRKFGAIWRFELIAEGRQ